MPRRWNRRWLLKKYKTDSLWENKLKEGVLKNTAYHNHKIPYKVEHNYEPDFTHYGDKTYYIEAKGRFRDSSEASKYIWVAKELTDKEELVFLLYKRNTPMPHAKKRKDGTKYTHEEWCTKNGFRYFYEDTIEELLS